MKIFKRSKALLLCAVMLCFAMLLGACGEQAPDAEPEVGANGNPIYKVAVVDGAGNPYESGVIVQFLQNGQQVAMQVIDANGVAAKELAAGDYTVELVFTTSDANCYYDAADLTLSADKTELEVVLAYTMNEEASSLSVDGKEAVAYSVNAGSTYVPLTAGERNYFLFAPTEAGTYEVSASEATAQVGYYGAPHFVQSLSAAEVVDNKLTVSVRADMIGQGGTGGTVLVIGVDAGGNENVILNVIRIGEPEYSVVDEPWTVYQTTAELAPYVLPAGAQLQKFDITSAGYTLVLNENDGFYHLDTADGPLVLVSLGVDNDYLDCYKTILDHTGVNKYFFDENGDFLKKERYTDCLMEYLQYIDEETGTYPLTEDLKYIIQQSGDYSGWFDSDSDGYIFMNQDGNKVPGVNADISWLFMCRYIAE